MQVNSISIYQSGEMAMIAMRQTVNLMRNPLPLVSVVLMISLLLWLLVRLTRILTPRMASQI